MGKICSALAAVRAIQQQIHEHFQPMNNVYVGNKIRISYDGMHYHFQFLNQPVNIFGRRIAVMYLRVQTQHYDEHKLCIEVVYSLVDLLGSAMMENLQSFHHPIHSNLGNYVCS